MTKTLRGKGQRAGTATIREVAKKAGVSIKTVSRVLNRENYVAEATRVRVESAMRDLDYFPHTGARNLRAHRRDCIGVTFSAPLHEVPISEALLSYLFAHLCRLFGARGHEVSFDFGQGAADTAEDYARGLWGKRYAALVILGPLAKNDLTVRRIAEAGYPYLTTSRHEAYPECSSATVDFEEASYVSTKYLIERGHRRIALLSSFDGYNAGEERRRGYRRALDDAGIELDERLMRGSGFEANEITSVVHRLLMERDVTALIDTSAAQDAVSIRTGARRAGRALGSDTEVVCWTYAEDVAVMSEASAHVWVPIREALIEGLHLLAEWYIDDGEGPISLLYRPTLLSTEGLQEGAKPKTVFTVRN